MENEGRMNNAAAASTTSQNEEQEPPIRSVVSLKNRKRIREFEKVEECFILDFDLHESSSKPPPPSQFDDDVNFKVIAVHGKVALRDFPHSRHQCAKYPFSKTPHETHCKLCHCYVCDIAAPCDEWSDHCHAVHIPFSEWWYHRRRMRGRRDSSTDSDSDSNYFA
ncbi:RPM1 interacting protein 13-like [Spinacia oleracea]|uniref:RPM1 interacting protein 13-like n=1 Tax=Spinacia oleracea TaxID=3562 RepID=A0ABM3RNQ5_SPIOL|nr:RPM1 interacting protein 13-like [Spinacia oleracea]